MCNFSVTWYVDGLFCEGEKKQCDVSLGVIQISADARPGAVGPKCKPSVRGGGVTKNGKWCKKNKKNLVI